MVKINYIKNVKIQLILSFENFSVNYFIKPPSDRMNQRFSVSFASIIYEFDIHFFKILIRLYFWAQSE